MGWMVIIIITILVSSSPRLAEVLDTQCEPTYTKLDMCNKHTQACGRAQEN